MTTKNDMISEAGTLHFHFMGKYSKLDRLKTICTRGKLIPFDEILRQIYKNW